MKPSFLRGSIRPLKNNFERMKACLLFKTWCVGLLLAPCFTTGQNDYRLTAYTYNDARGNINSNVPLNEINPHAWRHFHKLFPAADGGEYWFASEEGYQVSFMNNGHHYQAYFDQRGAYRYSLHYYEGKEIPRDPGEMISERYPDFRIDVVTEVTDGVKTIYLVKLVNSTTLRTLSVCDGKIEVIEELTNGGAQSRERQTASGNGVGGNSVPTATTPLISKLSGQ
jgi:hypothetical protein